MKARRKLLPHILVSLTAVLGAPAVALAQDPPPPAAPAPAGAPARESDGGTDHARVVGHFAVGFLGTQSIALGTANWAGGAGPNCRIPPNTMGVIPPCYPTLGGSASIEAPVVGVRYWLNDRIGLEGGIGLALISGSTEQYQAYVQNGAPGLQKNDVKKTSATAFIFHGAVPIALSTYKHFTFEVIPEFNVGFASGTQKDQVFATPGQTVPASGPDISLSGFLLDVGGRFGGELHFGFIGVPELAVQGTVGLHFSTRSTGATISGNSVKDSSTRIGTTVQASPFAIFTNNIAALYYF